MSEDYRKFKECLIEYDKSSAKEMLLSFNDLDHLSKLFFDTLSIIGEEWESGRLSLSQVYMAGVLCEELVNELYAPKANDSRSDSHIALVTFSDFHSLGRKIVYSYLTLSGYTIRDYGCVADIDKLTDRCITEKVKILLVSVLMLPSALKIKDLKQAFEKKNHKIVLIVGGAPFIFNNELYLKVEADDFGKTPGDAMKLINKWNEVLL